MQVLLKEMGVQGRKIEVQVRDIKIQMREVEVKGTGERGGNTVEEQYR